MNEIERNDAQRIGTVIRAARKLRGLSQAKISRELQVSQMTFSSIENGQVAISSSLWYRLSQTLELLPDHAFFEGIVDNGNVSSLNDPLETGFKIPKKYANNAFSTIRTSQAFFRFFERFYGKKGLEEFMKDQLKIDPDIRHIYNLRLSVRFNCDLSAYLIRAGHLKSNNLAEVTRSVINPKTHGMLARRYDGVHNPIELIKALVKNVALYERNFDYTIVDESKNSLEIASTPADFMRYFSYKEEELPNFINLYRLSFIESFSKYQGQDQPAQVRIVPSATKRRTECLFKITI